MEAFMFLGFDLNAWITIITVLGMFTILLFTKWRSDLPPNAFALESKHEVKIQVH